MNTHQQKRIREILRLFRPCLYFVVFLGSIYMLELVVMETVFWWVGSGPDDMPSEWHAYSIYQYAIILWLVFHALLRVENMNPVFQKSYRQWLASTPWTVQKDLPFNPVVLRLADWLVVGLALALWNLPSPRIYVLFAFFVPYCFRISQSIIKCKQYSAIYSAIWFASLVTLTIENAWLASLFVLATYLSCHWGFQKSLADFPWDESIDKRYFEKKKAVAHPAWPLVNKSGIVSTKPTLAWTHVVGISVTGAWLAGLATYLLESVTEASAAPELSALYVGSVIICFAVCVATVRSMRYYRMRQSPLGILARIGTGRLIIPRYDIALVPSLAIVSAGLAFGAPLVYGMSFLPLPVTAAVSCLVILIMGFGMGPSMPKWDLTGEYRTSLHEFSVKDEWKQI